MHYQLPRSIFPTRPSSLQRWIWNWHSRDGHSCTADNTHAPRHLYQAKVPGLKNNELHKLGMRQATTPVVTKISHKNIWYWNIFTYEIFISDVKSERLHMWNTQCRTKECSGGLAPGARFCGATFSETKIRPFWSFFLSRFKDILQRWTKCQINVSIFYRLLTA